MSNTTTERKSTRYQVKRWTAFSWENPRLGEGFAELQRDRASNLDRAARLLQRKLTGMYPRDECSVVVVARSHAPQLVFTLTLDAHNEDDARNKAEYRIKRTLSAKVPAGGTTAKKARLTPPWGLFTVEVIDA